MWIESAQTLTAGLRVLLPWLLIAAGVVAQVAAGHLLIARMRPGAQPPTEIADRTGPAVEKPVGLPLLEMPIGGGRVPTNPELLPGARRAYRGGEHQGIDFSCHPGTPVLAASEGWVMSIDDEPNLPEARRNELLGYCTSLGVTPPEVLSVLHGRRVTLCHGVRGGCLLTTSYSHLGAVAPGIRPGVHVHRGDLIGKTGSSGTSHAYRDDGWGELHFEIRLNGVPLGSGQPPQAAGQMYREFLAGEVTK